MITIILGILMLLFTGSAYAAPTVSGVTDPFLHNGTVTVNGSGFGTKSPVAPALWDNLSLYNGLSNGNIIPVGQICDQESNPNICLGTNPYGWMSGNGWAVGYKTTNPRGKITAAYSNSWSGSSVNGAALGGKAITGANTSNIAYLTWYSYFSQAPDIASGGNCCSNKLLRFDSQASWGPGLWEFIWEPTHLIWWQYGSGETDYYDYFNINIGAWNRLELSVAINGGTFSFSDYINNELQGSHTYSGGNMPYIINNIGADAANYPMGTVDWNTIYADNTLSRVEVCNAATKSGSTHCEIQIPTTTWNNGQLQITVNQGSFADSSTAYLYVADSTGTFNSTGYLVTFGSGGGGDTTPPTITAFTMPSTASSLTVNVSSFTATDDTAVTGYCITTTNSSVGCSWSGSAPSTATAGAAGTITWYAWARDAAGNVSNASTQTTTITLPTATVRCGGTFSVY